MMRNLSAVGLLFLTLSAYAQEESFILPQGEVGETTSEISEIAPPPVVTNDAWQGSAVANMLIEDGAFIPRRRSPWGLALFNWSNVNMKNAREGSGRLETYNYASFDYRLDWNSKISIRPEFYVSGAGKDFFGNEVAGESEMGDIYLQYMHNQWGLVPTPFGDVGLSGSLRIYYPNSENSKRQKQITRLQARMMFQTPIGGGFWLSYHFRPMYLVQSQKAYLNEFLNAKSNENYRLEQRLEVAKPIANGWALHQEIGVEHRRYYESTESNTPARTDAFFGMSTSVSWYVYGVSLKGGLNYESKMAIPDRNKQLYNAEDTTYFVMTSVRL